MLIEQKAGRNRNYQTQTLKQSRSDEKGMVSIGKTRGAPTATTGFTSNMHPQNDASMALPETSDILNYPYSYDQDRQVEVNFQEKLYRAGHQE